RSIITLSVDPESVEIVEDSYNKGKIKIFFTDPSGVDFRYIAITDLGFYDHAMQHHAQSDLNKLNSLLNEQDEVMLRIGLSRIHTNPQGKTGYWMQANGIYSFPDYPKDIRHY